MFSLADMYHRESRYDNAFELYRQANALNALAAPFKLDSWLQRITNITGDTDTLTPSQGSAGENLVFIIGMPRSGTTLCEQVLSAHPDILACGELAAMQNIETGLERQGINPYSSAVQHSDPLHTLQKAGALYLSALPKDHQKYQRVTDKAPLNFERIGLIHRIFPAARFVYCKRHPLDTVLSCYFQDFHSALNFASDLEVITQMYIQHEQLMQHWSMRLPGLIHTVNYESLVSDLENEATVMTEFLNCNFDPAMLNPHQQNRIVTTASNLQVPKPVYTTSINKWKNYQSHLDGIIKLLQEHAVPVAGL